MAALVAAEGQGAPQQTPYQSGEEAVDRYRVLDGVLWQAGVDSIDADEHDTQQNTDPPGIAGNVYRLDGDTWRKFRSIVGGEHVHDVAAWRGAVYAVGSGADTRAEFTSGAIFRYLWRSVDDGATFETITRIQHPEPGTGDTRWVDLLSTGAALYLFGYQSDFATNTASLRNAAWDGVAVTDLDATAPLRTVFPAGTMSLPDGAGLVWGLDVSLQPMRNTIWGVAADGSMASLASLAGWTVFDVARHEETAELVYLVVEGDERGIERTTFTTRVLVAPGAAPDDTVELLAFSTEVRPCSIAYWAGALFLGTADGQVLKSSPTQ
jgi:hypothetical protein